MSRRLVFGIYPGGTAGSVEGMVAGPPDNPGKILACLNELQGTSEPFVVRAYDRYCDEGSRRKSIPPHPENFAQYLRPGRPLELVLMFQSASGDVDAYVAFVRSMLQQHASYLYSVQVTEEANFTNGPDIIDGPYPRVQEALVQGVIAAKKELCLLGRENVKVGFNSTPTFGPSEKFWSEIGSIGGAEFIAALDYVGLDFFPDVFRPVPLDTMRTTVVGVLETMRNVWLPAAGIPNTVPIHITEHGWATGPDRTYELQAQVIETVIRTIAEVSEPLNVERYMMFDLRDSDSQRPELEADIFHHFGITRDDYTPKPAFETFQRLVSELGVIPSGASEAVG